MSDILWQRVDDWVGSEIEDSFVMVNIETGKYVSLNITASAVWQLLEQPHTQPQLEAALRQRFAVDEAACHQSISALLATMSELKLAVVVPH